ncbi:MAG: TauD/TfdA family dioxygenase [Alphaproteobacteria bacterium]
MNVATVNRSDALTIQPLCWALGVAISGIDLRLPIDDASMARIKTAVHEYGVAVFHDQDLTPEQQIAFSRRFGPLESTYYNSALNHPNHPEIFRVTNIPINGKPSESRTTGRMWHQDGSFLETPTFGSILYCIEAPAVGGTTMFASLYRAHDALSDGLRAMLAPLQAMHEFAVIYKWGTSARQVPSAEDMAKLPKYAHPILRRHPVTGRMTLFVNQFLVDRIVGMTAAESAPILDYLFRHQTQAAFTYRHAWRPKDLVFWDNQAVIHLAVPDFDSEHPERPGNRRLMHRTTVAG